MAPGLCVDPARVPCPKTCGGSDECDSSKGELCCNGICSASCPKTCERSDECTNQICCTLPVARTLYFGGSFTPLGYTTCNCSGSQSTCSGDSLLKCDGCSYQTTSCTTECKSKGYTSGTCQKQSTSYAECECSYVPPDSGVPDGGTLGDNSGETYSCPDSSQACIESGTAGIKVCAPQ